MNLYDANADYLARAKGLIESELSELCLVKLARGALSIEQRLELIYTKSNLEECVQGASHIQECIGDHLDQKQALYEQLDSLTLLSGGQVPICSSTSKFLPTLLFAKMVNLKSQCLIAHPSNPLLHIRLVELVPMPDTSEEILIKVRLTMDELEQKPVVLRKEIRGLASDRLQFAVFQEAFRLVHDEIMTPDDVDTVVADGIGPRFAFMGPWMTAHLNDEGLAEYLRKHNKDIYNVNLDCRPLWRLDGEAAQQIVDTMLHLAPIDKINERRAWRDKCIIELARMKEQLGDH